MDKIQHSVLEIISDIKKFGDKAICRYIRKYDNLNLTPQNFFVTENEIKEKIKFIDDKLATSIEKSAENIRLFHEQELKYCTHKWAYTKEGIELGQIFNPVEKVGIYVPGGKFCYFSTLLMTAIPARVAGVKEIIVMTPPNNITPQLLFSSKITKVDKICRIGGPMAIAALAYGTESIPKVDLIVGPGNIYVTEAKRQVYGVVGLDMLAGPSEIAIICDRTANPEYIYYDLLSQIEHDKNSKGYLFCDDIKIIRQIKKLIPQKIKKQIIISYNKTDKSIQEINKIAPEHLEIIHSNPKYILNKIRNAGMIFIGNYSPVVLGDYFAGPSHVLPTNRTATFSSGLSVRTFIKHTNYIKYTKNGLIENIDYIVKLSESEGLKFHSESIKIRRKNR
jgi:histidinol dehydrogenase